MKTASVKNQNEPSHGVVDANGGGTYVRIQYSGCETGLARLLPDDLAVIIEPGLRCNLWVGDLVQLSHHPADHSKGLPHISEILAKHYCTNTVVDFWDDSELESLKGVLGQLDTGCLQLSCPKMHLPGALLVSHHQSLNPRLLAESIGIDQRWDDVEALDEDEASELDGASSEDESTQDDIDPYER